MTIRKLARNYSNLKSHSLDFNSKNSKLPGYAENMCIEVYNKGSETVTFKTCHPEWEKMAFFGKSPKFWAQAQCKPGEWIFLPHQLYIAEVPSGSKEIPVVVNIGEKMFKGNTLASRPEAQKIRSFL